MSSNTLTPDQTEILAAVVDLIATREDAVRTDEIAERVDRNPYTIRTEMQQLTALQLLDGIPGPRGGYKPTVEAYRTLDTRGLEKVAVVPVDHEGIATEAVVESIDFRSVNAPDRCRATVTVRTGMPSPSPGDEISIGPTPNAGLTLSGTVESVESVEPDDSAAAFVLDVDEMATVSVEEREPATSSTEPNHAATVDSTAD
ncbi:Rrf2 family transcriptional regulator [Halopenitus persicus]|uniref:Rrf2 family transcriptional regulator n=1 Tax=Halopenitus persicus TaxID=1048396 RepID=UPI000BBAE1B2|nr:Rrf2 family transcriptional regulator [Halopenitus persicus]